MQRFITFISNFESLLFHIFSVLSTYILSIFINKIELFLLFIVLYSVNFIISMIFIRRLNSDVLYLIKEFVYKIIILFLFILISIMIEKELSLKILGFVLLISNILEFDDILNKLQLIMNQRLKYYDLFRIGIEKLISIVKISKQNLDEKK